MKRRIEAVIWDMGGVILRTEDALPRQDLARKYKKTAEELYAVVFNHSSAVLATLGKIDEEEHWANVGQTLGISQQDLLLFQQAWWAGDRIDQDLIDFIGKLKQEYKTALLSNAWSGARNALEIIYHCMHVFQYSIFSAEVGLMKPDPAIFIMLLNRMEVEPSSAIFIDDVITNIEAAQKLGIHGVLFKDPSQAMRDVRNLLETNV